MTMNDEWTADNDEIVLESKVDPPGPRRDLSKAGQAAAGLALLWSVMATMLAFNCQPDGFLNRL